MAARHSTTQTTAPCTFTSLTEASRLTTLKVARTARDRVHRLEEQGQGHRAKEEAAEVRCSRLSRALLALKSTTLARPLTAAAAHSPTSAMAQEEPASASQGLTHGARPTARSPASTRICPRTMTSARRQRRRGSSAFSREAAREAAVAAATGTRMPVRRAREGRPSPMAAAGHRRARSSRSTRARVAQARH